MSRSRYTLLIDFRVYQEHAHPAFLTTILVLVSKPIDHLFFKMTLFQTKWSACRSELTLNFEAKINEWKSKKWCQLHLPNSLQSSFWVGVFRNLRKSAYKMSLELGIFTVVYCIRRIISWGLILLLNSILECFISF